jgi:hypothetical protein
MEYNMIVPTRPKWAHHAVIDPKGWRGSKTGELLVSRRFSKGEIDAYNGAEAEPVDLDEPEGDVDTQVDLDAMKKAELIEYAEALGIELKSGLKKGEIIEAINASSE